MINESIRAAFERFWLHVVAALGNKADVNDLVEVEDSINELLTNKSDRNHTHDDKYDAAGSADTALTSAQSYTNTAIANLINSAPTTLDTLGEIAEAMKTNESVVKALDDAVGTKANASDLTDHTGNKKNPHGVTLSQLGVTATKEELNIMDGVTATTAEINVLKGITTTTTELNYMDGVTSNVQTQLDTKSNEGHTHNYAGSSSAGGAATSANKVNKTLTVKLNSGKNENTDLFTFDGSADKSVNITASSIGAAESSHSHDDKYYTETEIDTKLNGKANTSHGNHVPETQTASNKVFLRNDNTWATVTPANIGAAASSHTHTVANISDLTATATELNYMSGVKSNVQTQLDGKATSGHNHIYYGVSSTAADTAAKTVTVDNFSLVEGAMVIVKFTNTNSASSPTLNVSNTGAKPIYRYGTTAASTSQTTTGWRAGAVQTFVYDGSGWVRDYWENTTYSPVALGFGYATCSTAAATTAKEGTLSNYALTTGGIVSVKFTNAVPASATLNINSKGAKNIYYRGSAITKDIIKAGDIATFVYSSQYHLIAIDRWQNDIDGKQATITGAATTITSSNLTEERVLISNDTGKVAVSDVTTTELNYLDGVTSNVQTQLNGKSASGHKHSGSDITSGTVAAARLPEASDSASGIVNTSAQSFKGVKTFADGIKLGDATITYDSTKGAVVFTFK